MKIRNPIMEEMQIFNQRISKLLITDNPMLFSMYDFVFDEGVTQLRPLLTLLSAKLCGTVTDTTYNGAMLHVNIVKPSIF